MPRASLDDNALLELAAHLYQQGGAEGLTMDRLATQAGVSRATLYRRFGSQDALLARVAAFRGLPPEDVSPPDVRTRVLRAVRTAIQRHGLSGATVEVIAREAEVGPATIYRHFRDRDGLMRAFAETMRPTSYFPPEDAEPSGDLEGELTRIVSGMIQVFRDNHEIFMLILSGSRDMPDILGNARRAPERTLSRLQRYFEVRLKRGEVTGGDAWELSCLLMGLVSGFALTAPLLYDRPMPPVEEAAPIVVRLFLNGVRAPAPGSLK